MSSTNADERPYRRPLPRVIESAAEAFFGTVATARHRQALHPMGVGLAGEAVLHDAGARLARARKTGVEARLSRGVGLPHPLPDFNGVALRLLDAHGPGRHQDLLLVASGRRPGLRHLILPMPYLEPFGYSTVLPHRTRTGQRCIFRCDPLPIRTVGDAATALPLTVEVLVASLRGAWEPAATVVLSSTLASKPLPRFDPWNTGPDLIPSGVLNRLRAPAYAGSRAGAQPDRT